MGYKTVSQNQGRAWRGDGGIDPPHFLEWGGFNIFYPPTFLLHFFINYDYYKKSKNITFGNSFGSS